MPMNPQGICPYNPIVKDQPNHSPSSNYNQTFWPFSVEKENQLSLSGKLYGI